MARQARGEQASREAPTRSYSPPPDSLQQLQVSSSRDEPLPSVRPGRDSIRALGESVLRHAPRAAIGIALVIGVTSWALGGPDGIAKVAAALWGTVYRDEIASLRAEAQAATAETAKLRAEVTTWRAADRDEEIGYRLDAAQLWRKGGIDWPMPDGMPPRRPLEFVTPIRQPGVVKGGPSVVVRQPMPLPPAVPSASP
jgi:hypothetical protein